MEALTAVSVAALTILRHVQGAGQKPCASPTSSWCQKQRNNGKIEAGIITISDRASRGPV